MKDLLKRLNPIRWFEFKREAVIIFANLKRNEKAYDSLNQLLRAVGLTSYILGMIVYVILLKIIEWLL